MRVEAWRKPLRWVMAGLMLAWLGWRLTGIGWEVVWLALPTQPSFYTLVLIAYLVLPVADALIYRRLWGSNFRRTMAACLRKRVYNSALVGYSGEVVLLVWARRDTRRSDAAILHAIKDVNILSAVVSGIGAAVLVGWLATRVAFGPLPTSALAMWAAATVVVAAVLPLGLLVRRRVLAMRRDDIAAVLAIHGLRFGLGLGLLAAQWWLVLPGVAGTAMLTLLAVYVLVGRIPFVPNRDVLFVGIALAVSSGLAIPQTTLAGVLIATSAMQQLLHLAVFGVAALLCEDAP